MKRFLITGAFAVAIAGTLFFTNTFASGIQQSASEKTFTISESELNSANINKSTPVNKENFKGSVYYSKITSKANGGSESIHERWFDINTYEDRIDNHIINISGSPDEQNKIIYNSTYFKDMYKKNISIQRDDKGVPVSGVVTQYSDRVAKYNLSLNSSKETFGPYISQYKKPEWKLVSTQTSNDGKKLNKLSRTSKISLIDEELKNDFKGKKASFEDISKEYNMTVYAYIDEATGLPVKVESYIDKDGKTTLFSEETYEFKRLENTDGSIFDTSGVKLETGKTLDYDPEIGLG